MTTAFISHRDCLLHNMGSHHPKQPARLHAVEDQLIASGLINYLLHVEAPLAAREQLARVHAWSYIDSIEQAAPRTGLSHLDPDTAMNPHTLNAALRAAGAAVLATDMVIEGRSARMLNIPLAAYSAGREFRAAVEQFWLPALEAFRPEMLFVSAGFDAHRDDDMAMLRLVEADYGWVTGKIKDVADRHARGRIVSVLEGGYDLHALGRSVMTHLKVMGGL